MLKCGACETVITPKLGLPIPGYFEVRPATDILDDLYAKAVVFDNGKKICGFLVVDMLHITANLCNQIREKFRNTLMIDADGIMIAATHSHTSFAVEYNDEFSSVDEQ
ncbi:MAG: hypothetical protein IJT91_04020 [Clostridia bacterium]|nr:hypothetical protein [Clostridia bacterium]